METDEPVWPLYFGRNLRESTHIDDGHFLRLFNFAMVYRENCRVSFRDTIQFGRFRDDVRARALRDVKPKVCGIRFVAERVVFLRVRTHAYMNARIRDVCQHPLK